MNCESSIYVNHTVYNKLSTISLTDAAAEYLSETLLAIADSGGGFMLIVGIYHLWVIIVGGYYVYCTAGMN